VLPNTRVPIPFPPLPLSAVPDAFKPSCHCRNHLFTDTFQSYDGLCNNRRYPTWGSAHSPMLRDLRRLAPSLPVRPNPRAISNALFHQQPADVTPPSAQLSSMVTFFGQFLDHDVTLTQAFSPLALYRPAPGAGRMDIPVPRGDARFDPGATGDAAIVFSRTGSLCDPLGPLRKLPAAEQRRAGGRVIANEITSFVDGSQVYGSSEAEARGLRVGASEWHTDSSGAPCPAARCCRCGELRVSNTRLTDADFGLGPMMPYSHPDCQHIRDTFNAASAPEPLPCMYHAGDERANEQMGLTALHTLFVRYHNHHARRLRRQMEGALATAGEWVPRFGGPAARIVAGVGGSSDAEKDESIFQEARRYCIHTLQRITFKDFLPALTGRPLEHPAAAGPYTGHRPFTHPGMALEFAASGFRFGHSLVDENIHIYEGAGGAGGAGGFGEVPLVDAFGRPQLLVERARGIERVLLGAMLKPAQDTDLQYTNAVRNVLFNVNLDLGALNVQRGREVELPAYADVWRASQSGGGGSSGVPVPAPQPQWIDLAPDANLRRRIEHVYTRSAVISSPSPPSPWGFTSPSGVCTDGYSNIRPSGYSTAAYNAAVEECQLAAAQLGLPFSPPASVPSVSWRRRWSWCGRKGTSSDISTDRVVTFGLNWRRRALCHRAIFPTHQEPSVTRRMALEAVDLQVGILAEAKAPGAEVGPTLRFLLERQFARLRDGDRWYYEKVLQETARRSLRERPPGKARGRKAQPGQKLLAGSRLGSGYSVEDTGGEDPEAPHNLVQVIQLTATPAELRRLQPVLDGVRDAFRLRGKRPAVPHRTCCSAFSARCLACHKGEAVEEYCRRRPDTMGCKSDHSSGVISTIDKIDKPTGPSGLATFSWPFG